MPSQSIRLAALTLVCALVCGACTPAPPSGGDSTTGSASTSSASAPVSSSSTPVRDDAAFIAALDEVARRYNTVGMSVAVVKDGQLTLLHHYGVRDRERSLPVDDDTVFRVASLSKVVTTIAAMQLWDDGLLSLDDDVGDYFDFTVRNPYHPDVPITIRQLMTHTAGMIDKPEYERVIALSPPPSLRDIFATDEVAKFFADTAPGEHYEYANLGPGMLGGIVERVTGERFRDYCRDALFAPLGVRASYLKEGLEGYDNVANIYRGDRMSVNVETMRNYTALYDELFPLGESYLEAHANLYISARDLVPFMQALLDGGQADGRAILSPEATARINDIQMTAPGPYVKMRGLSIHITDDLVAGRRMRGHQGNAYGMLAAFFYDLDDNSGVIAINNGCDQGKDAIGFDAWSADIVRTAYANWSLLE